MLPMLPMQQRYYVYCCTTTNAAATSTDITPATARATNTATNTTKAYHYPLTIASTAAPNIVTTVALTIVTMVVMYYRLYLCFLY